MEITPEREWFQVQLRLALGALYNPPQLRKNPLLAVFHLEGQHNPPLALQTILLEAIEALHPQPFVPVQSDVWRFYQVLRRRYSEQAQQAQVANDLGLSTRQLQRMESQARDELAAYLWRTYQVEQYLEAMHTQLPDPVAAEEIGRQDVNWQDADELRTQELEYLSRSLSAQVMYVEQAVEDVLETVAPLAAAAQVQITTAVPKDLPPLLVQAPLLQQGLVNLLCFAIDFIGSDNEGSIRIEAVASARTLVIRLAANGRAAAEEAGCETNEQVATADHLARLCGGLLTMQCSSRPAAALQAELTLPALEQAAVLAIDDNLDTQQLYNRHLAGSPFRLISATTAGEGLALAIDANPAIIILDVMMPGQDGWTLLGQLREHPVTRTIPVIVCSILPQESLALVLGAADFLRKPVRRADLLQALERHHPTTAP